MFHRSTATSTASLSAEAGSAFWPAIADIHPVTFGSQARLATVLAYLKTSPSTGCILATRQKKVTGIATRQDLMMALAQHSNWASMRLSDIVTRPVITVAYSEINNISRLVERLEQHRIGYLPVVDETDRLMGVIDRNCLLHVLQDQRCGQESDQSLPTHPHRAHIFADITLKIRQSLQLKEILQTSVDEIQRLLKADRVLIYQVMPDGTGKTISEAVTPAYPSILEIPFPEEVFPQEYQALYAQGRVRAVADVHAPDAHVSQCLLEFIDQWCIKSKLIVPIVRPLDPPETAAKDTIPIRKHLWGLLIAHQCDHIRHWSDFEQDLMQQLAGQSSLALSQSQLMSYLEARVRRRTAELTKANRTLKQEIQERKQVEEALRQSETQLRLITNNLPVLIAYVDRQQHYQFNNQVYEQWLGFLPDQMHGRPVRQLIGEVYYQKIRPYIEAALGGEQVSYESELTFADGRDRSVNVTYIPHIDHAESEAQVKGFFALTTDISDRKAIERMKDEFIAVVSHELRTPLTSIHTSLKLLATGLLGDLLT